MSSHYLFKEGESLEWRKYIVQIIKVACMSCDYITCGLVFVQLYEYLAACYSQSETAFKSKFIVSNCSTKYTNIIMVLTKFRNLYVHRPCSTDDPKQLFNKLVLHKDLEDFITEVIEPDESCLYSELVLFISKAREVFPEVY